MEIKSDTPFRIKIAGFLILSGLFLFDLLFSPPQIFDNLPRWLILTILGSIIFGYFLLLINPTIKRKKDTEKISNMYLMTYGQKISVDLTKCEVTENSSTESILTYIHYLDNNTEKFNTKPIPLDKRVIQSKLNDKKSTFIFVDNKDRTRYFFDIEFIYD